LIPMPPSKAQDDPLYDDRLTRMLTAIRPQPPLDIREIIVQKTSTGAAHHSDARPRPETLEALYTLNPRWLVPTPTVIGLFDDVLTTGAHFKAAQSLLNKAFPGVRIIGLFIARRVPGTMDMEALFGLSDA
jgi:predicted amidophosphoribosyltransferase